MNSSPGFPACASDCADADVHAMKQTLTATPSPGFLFMLENKTFKATSRARSIPLGAQPQAHNPINQLPIGNIRLRGGLREILVGGEDRIRIGLDEIDFVVRRDAQIEPRVTVNREQMIDALAGLLDVAPERGVESFGEPVL